MYRVICTGKNLAYGRKGERRDVADTFVRYAERKGWLKILYYNGRGKGIGIKVIE